MRGQDLGPWGGCEPGSCHGHWGLWVHDEVGDRQRLASVKLFKVLLLHFQNSTHGWLPSQPRVNWQKHIDMD